MRRARFLPLVVLSLAACAAPPVREALPKALEAVPPIIEVAPLDADFDVEHYRLELSVDPEQRRIDGVCHVRFFPRVDAIERIELDLVGLEVHGVTDAQGRALRYRHRDGKLAIELGRSLSRGHAGEVAIEYGGRPLVGLYFVGHPRVTHLFTQGECEDARGWFPCQDHPGERATSELVLDLPPTWTAVAAGERIEAREVDGRRRERWRMHMPHSSYLETLVAGELAEVRGEWDGIPLTFHAPLAYGDRLEESLEATDDALGFLSDLTGFRYPYAKYATTCVEDFPFGGMENISATTLGVAALRDETARADGNSDTLVVHEAAHQWFGDLLTPRDWSQVWLSESFATYCTALFLERTRGPEDFDLFMDNAVSGYVAGNDAHPRAIVDGSCREPLDLFFSGHVYQGGASRLNLLRSCLGDPVFFDGVQRYVAENAGRSVTTDDLREAFERASGRDLKPFFEQWFESPGYPELETAWVYDAERKRILLTINQTQSVEDGTPAVFEGCLEVEIGRADGRASVVLQLDERRDLSKIAAQEEPRWVLVNPRSRMPARIDSKKSVEEWVAIARGSGPVGRRRAVRALAERAPLAQGENRAALVALLTGISREDGRGEVRTAALEALGRFGGPQARAALIRAAREDREMAVRASALRTLSAVGADAELADLGRTLVDEAPSWGVVAAAAQLVQRADPEHALGWLRSELEASQPDLAGQPHVSLLPALIESAGGRARTVLESLAGDENLAIALRVAAVRGLGRLAREDEELVPLLAGWLDSDEIGVRAAAVDALVDSGRESARSALAAYYPTCHSPREKRRIEGFFGL